MAPPQPNSTSSGWEPKARSGDGSGRGFDIGLIRPLDGVADDVVDLGRVFLPKVILFAGTRHIVRAPDHRLHPAQAGVARRADLFAGVRYVGEVHVLVTPLVQPRPALDQPGPHDLALVRQVDVEVFDVAGRPAEGWIARAGHADALEQAHLAVHVQAEIGDVIGLDGAELIGPPGPDVG